MASQKTLRSPYRNLFSGEYKLAKDNAEALILTKKNSTPTHTFNVLFVSTPAAAHLFTPAFAPTVSVTRYIIQNL